MAGAAGLAAPSVALAQAREVEGGIGGTGIVGLLTEFGSLIIAGRQVETDARTVFQDAFGRLRERDLRLGDNLTIEAEGPANALVARRVTVTNPLVGRVTDMQGHGRSVVVNGTKVDLAEPMQGPGLGAHVTVSGLWRGDKVVSAYLRPARANVDLVAGTVNRRAGRVLVGGVEIRGRGRNGMQDGGFASAIGRFDATNAVFVADRVQTDRFAGIQIDLRNLAIEGYLEPVREAPGYRVSGLGHSFKRNLQLAQFEGDRMLFAGSYDGLFQAQSARVLPENTEQRKRLFQRLIAADQR